MERKFERELGRKLNQRSIEPSQDAWERVNLQRGRRQKKRTYIYYWIAASVITAIGLVWIASGGREAQTGTQQVVTIEKAAPETDPQRQPENTVAAKRVQIGQQHLNPKPQNAAIAYKENEPQDKNQSALTVAAADITHPQIASRINPHTVFIASPASKAEPDDVDALINRARSEIAAGRGLLKPTDASALLKVSESELDENFRSGIIENLFKQKRIKVALSSH